LSEICRRVFYAEACGGVSTKELAASIGLRFVTLAERLESPLEQHVDLVSSRAVKPKLLKQIQAELIDV
jgi:predicted nucleotidyltransferase